MKFLFYKNKLNHVFSFFCINNKNFVKSKYFKKHWSLTFFSSNQTLSMYVIYDKQIYGCWISLLCMFFFLFLFVFQIKEVVLEE